MKIDAFIYKTVQDSKKPVSIDLEKKSLTVGRSSYNLKPKASMFDNGQKRIDKRSKSKGMLVAKNDTS